MESRYKDGLDKIDEEEINALQLEPWRKSFLIRFYEKLSKNNLSKKDICTYTNEPDKEMKNNPYRLNESTLSYYTNYKSKAFRSPSVDALISISNALNVSIDYLLGIESSEQHDITNIYDKTGLTKKSIDILDSKSSSSSDTRDFINALLQSSNFSSLIQQLNHLFIAEYVSSDILSAYSDTLMEIISSSFSKYMNATSPIDRNPDAYKKYFEEEIKASEIIVNKDFLKKNVSSDRFNQILILSKTNNTKLPQTFFNDTVTCLYDILSFEGSSDYYRNLISNLFSNFLDEFLVQKKNKLSTQLKNFADSHNGL